MPRLSSRTTNALLLAALAGLFSTQGHAAPVHDPFDGPTPVLKLLATGPPVRVLKQARIRLPNGGGAERIDFGCDAGYAANFIYVTDPLAVLDELQIRVHLATSRPGARIGLRLVLPRTNDPATGDPLVTIAAADPRLDAAAAWGWIVVEQVPQLVEAHVRALRVGRLGATVDPTGAYVTGIVLSCPGAPGGAWLMVEDLTINGAVEATGSEIPKGESRAQPAQAQATVAVRPGGEVTADDRPLYPLIWTHQGESLERLAKIGFNVVAVSQPAEQLDLDQARELGLWLIAPPPEDLTLLKDPAFADSHQRVLAWWIDPMENAATQDQQAARCGELRDHDVLLRRPLVSRAPHPALPPVRPELLARPVGDSGRLTGDVSSAELAIVAVTHGELLMQQRSLLATRRSVSPWRPEGDVAEDVWSALEGGAAGIWFDSDFELSQSPAAERALDELTLHNRRLSLMTPWLIAGRPVAIANGALGWSRDQSYLLVGRSMFGLGEAITATLPTSAGIDATMAIKRLDLASLESVHAARVPGGVRIDTGRPLDAIIACQDARVLNELTTEVNKRASDNAERLTRLAISDLLRAEALQKELFPTGAPVHDLATVRQEIGAAKSALAVRNWPAAMAAASQSRVAAAVLLAQSRSPTGLLVSSPLAGSPETMVDNIRLLGPLAALPRGPNLLAGGDFESLEACRACGWKHSASNGAGNAAIASAGAPQGAGYLRLSSDAPAGSAASVVSPTIPTSSGQTLEVLGMVRFDGEGGVLRISDTLGGTELTLLVRGTIPWRPFRIVRIATQEPLELRFELEGAGAAGIDAVMVRQVIAAPSEPAQARRGAERPQPK